LERSVSVRDNFLLLHVEVEWVVSMFLGCFQKWWELEWGIALRVLGVLVGGRVVLPEVVVVP
jgi:hypothetical protein